MSASACVRADIIEPLETQTGSPAVIDLKAQLLDEVIPTRSSAPGQRVLPPGSVPTPSATAGYHLAAGMIACTWGCLSMRMEMHVIIGASRPAVASIAVTAITETPQRIRQQGC